MPVQKFRSIEEMIKATEPFSEEPPFERFVRLCSVLGHRAKALSAWGVQVSQH